MYWSYDEPTSMDNLLTRLDVLLERIAALSGQPIGPCGSAENPHMWVRLKHNDGTWYSTCAKCGAGR